MNRETIRSFDGKSISVAVWHNNSNPKGVVQILHGLAEHIARYDDFAQFLVKNGYIVLGDDHRGHGETDKDRLGKIDDGNIFENTVKDALYLTETFSRRYDLPVVVLGHSYGSFLTRRYMTLQKSEVVKGYILSGTSHVGRLQLAFGRFLTKMKSKGRKDDEAKIIIKQTFKKYDKKTKRGRNDWLTREEEEVGKYNLDPYCGFYVSYGFYKYFFDGIASVNKLPLSLSKSAKIFIASGSADAFGGNGKDTEKIFQRYLMAGYNPRFKLYEDARHEILNEINKEEVYSDFLDFIISCFVDD